MFTSFRRANTQSSVITRIPYSSHYPLQSVSSNSGSVMQFRTCLTGLGEQSIDPSIECNPSSTRGRKSRLLPRDSGGKFFSQKSFSLDLGHVGIWVGEYLSCFIITLVTTRIPNFEFLQDSIQGARFAENSSFLSIRRRVGGEETFFLLFFFYLVASCSNR